MDFNFESGDEIIVKSWEEMERKYGLTRSGYINTYAVFTEEMKVFCGKTGTIVRFNDNSDIRIDFFDYSLNRLAREFNFDVQMIKYKYSPTTAIERIEFLVNKIKEIQKKGELL